MELVQDLVRLVCVGNSGIEVVDVEALAVDLELNSTSSVSKLVEIAIIFDSEDQFFD